MSREQHTQDGAPVTVRDHEHILEVSEAPECDYCGEPGELSQISDCDPAVGYHSSLLICRACYSDFGLAKRPAACGSCR